MPQSAFIVRVPEAEPVVRGLRERFDPAAKQGVPAHITILYPFMSPELVSSEVLALVQQTLSEVPAFQFELARVGRFPATTYLAPEPAAPLVRLTQRLVRRFPAYQPYGGEHQGVVPHLTVAHGTPQEAALAEVELVSALQSQAVISSTCREVVLLENSSGLWREMHVFSLSSGGRGG
jgi:2'-5' RNA ligase